MAEPVSSARLPVLKLRKEQPKTKTTNLECWVLSRKFIILTPNLPEYQPQFMKQKRFILFRRIYHVYRRVTGVNVPDKSTRWVRVRLLLSLLNTSANVRCESWLSSLLGAVFVTVLLTSSSWRLCIVHFFMQLLQYLWQGTNSFLFWEMMVTTFKMREPTADRHYN